MAQEHLLEYMTNESISALLSTPEQRIQIDLADGKADLKSGWVAFNIPFWRALQKYGVPVTKEIGLWDIENPVLKIADYQTRVFQAILDHIGSHPVSLNHDILMIQNELYNIGVRELPAKVSSISGYEICKTMLEPEIAALRHTEIDPSNSTTVNEAIFKQVHTEALKILKRPDLKHNAVYPFHRLGNLSQQQLPQTMISMGFRSDIDDSVISYPLTNSFQSGMKSDIEYLADSCAAKISTWYNAVGMPATQYTNRQIQMVPMVLKHLYDGDCGSNVLVEMTIPEKYAYNFLHKHIYDPKKGEWTTLSKQNIGDYVSRIVRMKSPIGCTHVNGVCEKCGGLLTRYIPIGTNMGLASTVEISNPVAQLTLSTKHFSRTDVSNYQVPREIMDIFMVNRNDIYLNEANRKEIDTLEIGINLDFMPNPEDLKYILSRESINEEHFSSISEICLRRAGSSDIIGAPVSIKSTARTLPYFAKEFLWHVKQHVIDQGNFKIDQMLWFPLKGMPSYKPILRCRVMNYSIRRYAKQIETFLSADIGKYTSASEALTDFSNLIYQKINRNIYHLEMILRGYMITGPNNYRIPVISNPNEVLFGRTREIDLKRTVGGQFAFERHQEVLADPTTYLYPKETSVYDTYFGFDDSKPRRA